MRKCVVLTEEEHQSICRLLRDSEMDAKLLGPSYRQQEILRRVQEALDILEGREVSRNDE